MSAIKAPRSKERRPLNLMVKGRVQSRAIYADLVDISEGGCKLRGSRGFARVGDRVTIRIGGINSPLGTVVWVEDRFAGIAFEGQMHEAVLDHLCASNIDHLRPERQRLHRL